MDAHTEEATQQLHAPEMEEPDLIDKVRLHMETCIAQKPDVLKFLNTQTYNSGLNLRITFRWTLSVYSAMSWYHHLREKFPLLEWSYIEPSSKQCGHWGQGMLPCNCTDKANQHLLFEINARIPGKTTDTTWFASPENFPPLK